MLYFAYGSNLWQRGMARRCPKARPVAAARLPGYRLVFNGYAAIEPDTSASVAGALYQLTPQCLRSLDAYEDAPRLYRREAVTVIANEKAVEAFTYIMNGGARAAPDPAYYGEIARGYADWGLDAAELRRARLAVLHPPARAGAAARERR